MIRLGGRTVEAVLFDKDGTLVDFHATWDRALGATLAELAPDDAALREAARAVGYDLDQRVIESRSPFVAETNATVMELLADWIDVARFETVLSARAKATVAPATGAAELLDGLVAASVPVGVVTNDSETVARDQIADLGWSTKIPVVVGYDSGFGAKPDAGPVLAALDGLDADTTGAILVGDSWHDLEAARRAAVASAYVGNSAELARTADMAVADLVGLASLIG